MALSTIGGIIVSEIREHHLPFTRVQPDSKNWLFLVVRDTYHVSVVLVYREFFLLAFYGPASWHMWWPSLWRWQLANITLFVGLPSFIHTSPYANTLTLYRSRLTHDTILFERDSAIMDWSDYSLVFQTRYMQDASAIWHHLTCYKILQKINSGIECELVIMGLADVRLIRASIEWITDQKICARAHLPFKNSLRT